MIVDRWSRPRSGCNSEYSDAYSNPTDEEPISDDCGRMIKASKWIQLEDLSLAEKRARQRSSSNERRGR